jgi:hypothetical protein
MREFYEDGVNILEWFKKHRSQFFTTRNVVLLGIEMPLMVGLTKNLFLKGYIDFVLYDKDLDKVYIYDIKTSRSGWNDKAKKDEIKLAQILLYKEYFSRLFNWDVDKIEVEFFIVKRKIWEESEYTIPRIQEFTPASGKIKRAKSINEFRLFIEDCFDKEGKPLTKEFTKQISLLCVWCQFNDEPSLCNKINLP